MRTNEQPASAFEVVFSIRRHEHVVVTTWPPTVSFIAWRERTVVDHRARSVKSARQQSMLRDAIYVVRPRTMEQPWDERQLLFVHFDQDSVVINVAQGVPLSRTESEDSLGSVPSHPGVQFLNFLEPWFRLHQSLTSWLFSQLQFLRDAEGFVGRDI